MIAKAGLGLIGLGAISVGGVALANPGWLGMRSQMPDYHTLKEDNGFGDTYKEGDKFGKKYGRYLVGATNKGSTSGTTNEDWWKWALKRLQDNRPRNGKFKTINKWYESSGTSALNKVCEDAYKKNETELKDNQDTNEANFKKTEVWKYCSIGGTQPQTIQEFNTEKQNTKQEKYGQNSAIGSESDQQSKLLSIKSEANKWIWDLKDKDFGSEAITDGFFKVRKDEANRKSIKDICAEAYGEQENTGETGVKKITKTDTEKYCSLTGTNS